MNRTPVSSVGGDSMALSSNATYIRPRTRQRIHKAPPPLDIPHIDQDAAERKRVLNVLAQRRYRERKRLGRKAQDVDQSSSETSIPDISQDTASGGSSEGSPDKTCYVQSGAPDQGGLDLSELDMDWASIPTAFESTVVSNLLTTQPSPSTQLPDFTLPPLPNDPFASSTIDPSQLVSGSSTTTSSSSSSYTSLGSPTQTLSASSDADFPDSYYICMPELALLRAFTRIGARLGFTGSMWSMTANSPFNTGTGTPAALLPPTWRPTAAQVLVPHHPVVDFLPWPSVRDRILSVFTLPAEERPEAAQGPLALVNLAYDLEDAAEGIRIWGADPYDVGGWEVGQVLFERWWFIFDREVVAQSNRLRAARGAESLKLAPMPGGRVIDVTSGGGVY